MKHFAKTMTLGMKGKLDEEDELPTPSSLRVVMRRFYNAWELSRARQLHQGEAVVWRVRGSICKNSKMRRMRKVQVLGVEEIYPIGSGALPLGGRT